jgi:hypothetical protein
MMAKVLDPNDDGFTVVNRATVRNAKRQESKQRKSEFDNFCTTLWAAQRAELVNSAREKYEQFQPKSNTETDTEYKTRTDKAMKAYRRKTLDCGRSIVDCRRVCKYNATCDKNRQAAFVHHSSGGDTISSISE